MNWHKTKTIFIICFLLLDLFLGYQLYQRQQKNLNYGTIASEAAVKSDIKKPANIPQVPQNISFLKGTQQLFVNDKGDLISSVQKLQGPKGSTIQTIQPENGGSVITGTFKKPITVPDGQSGWNKILTNDIYHGNEYLMWKRSDKTKSILFVQMYKESPVFIKDRNDLSMLQFVVKNGKIISYQQSYFKFNKTNAISIITPTTAINNLIEKNNGLFAGQHPKISSVNLAYFNLVGDTNQNSQLIFVPAWHIIVKTDAGNKEFFVNAATGSLQTIDNTTG